MKSHIAMQVLESLVWVIAGNWMASESLSAATIPAADPRLDMVRVLQAMGPHPSLGEQAQVFGRLVGTWDGEYTSISKDGKSTHDSGEWIFGWILDGRAMQDVLIFNAPARDKERYVGTTVRYFDPKTTTWSVTYIDPENNRVSTLTGGAVAGDRIELRGPLDPGKEARWRFDDIRSDSWVFRGEISYDGGKTWKLRAEYHMKRHAEDPISNGAHRGGVGPGL
jgi:hypothetical protein